MNSQDSSMAANAMVTEARNAFLLVSYCMAEPSVMYRPALSVDGNKWCALYGDNLQDGVAGFGDSPQEAMCDFNANWYSKLQARPAAGATA
jgi:hypothetical protein